MDDTELCPNLHPRKTSLLSCRTPHLPSTQAGPPSTPHTYCTAPSDPFLHPAGHCSLPQQNDSTSQTTPSEPHMFPILPEMMETDGTWTGSCSFPTRLCRLPELLSFLTPCGRKFAFLSKYAVRHSSRVLPSTCTLFHPSSPCLFGVSSRFT